jgi:hypothetical protein
LAYVDPARAGRLAAVGAKYGAVAGLLVTAACGLLGETAVLLFKIPQVPETLIIC